jgi:hypothetical protein
LGASRVFDVQNISPTSGVVIQFPLGREPMVAVSKFLRLRVKSSVAYNVACGIIWEE